MQKLIRTGFGSNNVDHCTRLCHASSVAALLENIGSGAVTAPFNAALDADVIIVIGANPTENHPVAATYFKQAAKRGKTLIVMDPRGQALKRHATHMLQFKPGTDVALLNALMHVIVAEGLYDRQYIQAHTEGFEQLEAHLAGLPARAHGGGLRHRCRHAAHRRAQASRPPSAAIVFWGMGISQHVHGTDNARCLISLVLMCGQVGRPGTGLHPLRGQNNVQGASDAGLIPMMLPDYGRVATDAIRARFEELWGTKLDPEPGLTVVEIVHAIHDGVIKGMYIMGENPAMSDPDAHHARARAREARASGRAGPVPDRDRDLCRRGAAGLGLAGEGRHGHQHQPPGADGPRRRCRCRARRARTGGSSRRSRAGSASTGATSIRATCSPRWRRRCRRSPTSPGSASRPRARSPIPATGPTSPATTSCSATASRPATAAAGSRPADVLPPDELPDETYPMVLTTGRQLEHWHTGAMTRRASTLDALEPEAVASLHPADLRQMGVAPGEPIRVSTRRGTIELMARADRAVAQGMVFIPFCYAEAAANLLTNPQLDPFGKIPEYKFCAARVEKAEAPAQAAEESFGQAAFRWWDLTSVAE